MMTENNLSTFIDPLTPNNLSDQQLFIKNVIDTLRLWETKNISKQSFKEMSFNKASSFICRKDIIAVATDFIRVIFSRILPNSKPASYSCSAKKLIMSFMISTMAKEFINTNTKLDKKLEFAANELVSSIDHILPLSSPQKTPSNYRKLFLSLKNFIQKFRTFDSLFQEWSALDRAMSLQALKNQMSAIESIKSSILKRSLSPEEAHKWLNTVDTYKSQINTRLNQFNSSLASTSSRQSKLSPTTKKISSSNKPLLPNNSNHCSKKVLKILSHKQFDLNLVHEKLMNPNGVLQLPSYGLKHRTKLLMHKAYFDSIFNCLAPYNLNSLNYMPILKLVDDISVMLIKCFPTKDYFHLSPNKALSNHLFNKKKSLNELFLNEIKKNLDKNLIKKQILNNAFCIKSLFDFVISVIHKICTPARDIEVALLEKMLIYPPPIHLGKISFDFYMQVCKKILELLEKIQLDLMFFDLNYTLNKKFMYKNYLFCSYPAESLHCSSNNTDKKSFLIHIERCYFVNTFNIHNTSKTALSRNIPNTNTFISMGLQYISSPDFTTFFNNPPSSCPTEIRAFAYNTPGNLLNAKLVFSSSLCSLLFSHKTNICSFLESIETLQLDFHRVSRAKKLCRIFTIVACILPLVQHLLKLQPIFAETWISNFILDLHNNSTLELSSLFEKHFLALIQKIYGQPLNQQTQNTSLSEFAYSSKPQIPTQDNQKSTIVSIDCDSSPSSNLHLKHEEFEMYESKYDNYASDCCDIIAQPPEFNIDCTFSDPIFIQPIQDNCPIEVDVDVVIPCNFSAPGNDACDSETAPALSRAGVSDETTATGDSQLYSSELLSLVTKATVFAHPSSHVYKLLSTRLRNYFLETIFTRLGPSPPSAAEQAGPSLPSGFEPISKHVSEFTSVLTKFSSINYATYCHFYQYLLQ
ncbi:T-complex protein 11-like protein 2 [Smittium culicis]|uniref:T-complex protein 11-like protein 2 n=1 Tax=Smittium culicis TaxID=133412 RepID=A0A1R1YGE3_9FUNG|nr:T-complex protein 11-like protein 2 [Smittium culicis]